MCFEYRLFCFLSSLKYNNINNYILIRAMCSISVVTDLSEREWSREQGCLQVVWDSPENLQKVHRTEYFLTQGCQCKTGYTTRRFKCTKESTQCGPRCHCINCKNTKTFSKTIKERTGDRPRSSVGNERPR